MKLLSWNCQGLGSNLTGKALKRLQRKHDPDLLFLMETKQPDEIISKWQTDLHFWDNFVVSSVGTSGGLALLWKDTVSVVVLHSCKNYIDCVVTFVAEGFHCKITCVYGNPHTNEKSAFWYSMMHRFSPLTTPWLCIGDFNEILNASEKRGGAPPLQWRLNLFRSFLSQTELRDLHFQGPMFTWYNLRHNQIYIKERLDRCLGNVHWCASQPSSQLFTLPKLGSDHRPILLDTNPLEIRGPLLFRFEHTWTTHDDCFTVIRDNWHKLQTPPVRSPMIQWSQNLHSCKKALVTWSKQAFPNSKEKVDELTIEMEALLATPGPQDGLRLQHLSTHIDHLWGLEEIYWHQRSRINWLNLGDRNTHFFHQSTIQRRQFNKIFRIKGANDQWLHSETDIMATISQYFQDIYTTDGPREWDEVLNLVDPIITPEVRI